MIRCQCELGGVGGFDCSLMDVRSLLVDYSPYSQSETDR